MYINCSISKESPIGLWATPSSDGVWGLRIANLYAGMEVFVLGNDLLANRGEIWREVRVRGQDGNFYFGWVLGSNLVRDQCQGIQAIDIDVESITPSTSQVEPNDFDFAMAVIDCEAGGNPQQIVDISYVIQNRIRKGGTLISVLNDGFDCARDENIQLRSGYGRNGVNTALLEIIIQALLNGQDLSELDLSGFNITGPTTPGVVYGQYTYGVYVRPREGENDRPSEKEILDAIRADDLMAPICLCDVRTYLVGWTALDAGGRSTLIFRASAGCQDATWQTEIDNQVKKANGNPDNIDDRRDARDILREELGRCNY